MEESNFTNFEFYTFLFGSAFWIELRGVTHVHVAQVGLTQSVVDLAQHVIHHRLLRIGLVHLLQLFQRAGIILLRIEHICAVKQSVREQRI